MNDRRQTTDDDAMDALGWARAFDDSDAEGESEREDDDGVVVVDRSAVALGAGSRASTRETAPREDGASRDDGIERCLLYTSPSPRDQRGPRMPSSA